jgi:peptidoglycan/xylan/chitin deacetylase (PgdA/CDA1 family)
VPERILILNFHGIGTPGHELPPGEQKVWLDEPRFRQVMDFAKTRSDIELTFDDANESDFTAALPALQARGMKAQFFLVAQRIGQPGYLSSAQVKGLSAAGMKIGNHGMRHRPWAGLGQRDLDEELVEAKDRLEQMLGTAIVHAACPFGSYNRRVISALKGFGYKGIYTSDGGLAAAKAWLRPRSSVQRDWNQTTIEAMLVDELSLGRRVWRQLKLLAKRCR